MDVAHETSPAPADPKKVFSKPQRHWTIAHEGESTTSLAKGNGRSSTESSNDVPRPQTSGETGDSSKGGVSGISKLLPKGRRWKKKSDNDSSSQLSAETESRRSSAVGSQDGNSVSGASVNGGQSQQENEQIGNHLIDDSEPDG